MMWFLAALAVLAMGGVALLAAGKGAPLAPAFDDRPDAVLPTGEITGDDLRRVRFTLAFRGYRMSEVDAVLDRLAQERDDAVAALAAAAPAEPVVEPAEEPAEAPAEEPVEEPVDAQGHPDAHPEGDSPTSPLQGG
ncbi:DivIVA domain-containing protein [Nocardioides sp. GY 10127]|uniref:DivIVA domain-containing protein n=1 Tax=Nocardioides sp. GY 10127 TaxID=2569762 RepID=UPI001F0CEBB2|nr:DivIVA domain-containing protein [Nocardioides sp. GY 10127]